MFVFELSNLGTKEKEKECIDDRSQAEEKKENDFRILTSTRHQREAQRERSCDLSFVFTLLFGCFLCVGLSTLLLSLSFSVNYLSSAFRFFWMGRLCLYYTKSFRHGFKLGFEGGCRIMHSRQAQSPGGGRH